MSNTIQRRVHTAAILIFHKLAQPDNALRRTRKWSTMPRLEAETRIWLESVIE
jgi:hypothetical protein